MNKNQVNKRTKRNQVSKRKRKQRNIQNVEKKKLESLRKEKLMQYFMNLSKTKQKEVLKNIDKDEQ